MKRFRFLYFIAVLLGFSFSSAGQEAADATATPDSKRMDKRLVGNIMKETDPDFFKSEEARRVGDQILLWQRNTGGWPKNIDMVSPMSDEEKRNVVADKDRKDDSTTDNDATSLQITYLARLYNATSDTKYRDAICKGIEYLLSGQYDNGGWPQFWPEMRDYQPFITFNDDAMVNTMRILRDIAASTAPFDSDLCDEELKERMRKAFDMGVECILATQIVKDGVPTVWCQQHHHVSLLPEKARAYELPSYCTQESAAIVRLLMDLPDPDERVKKAVHSAMAWFDRNKIGGFTYKRVLVDGKWRAELLENPANDTPLWARFYDLEECLPFVCDRDGIPRRNLDEIGDERRNGYSWYNNRPAFLYEIYSGWADANDPAHKIDLTL